MNETYTSPEYTFANEILTIHGNKGHYVVRVEGSRRFRLTKTAGDMRSYVVDFRSNTCNCHGFQRHGHCKHHNIMADLMEAGAFGDNSDQNFPQPSATIPNSSDLFPGSPDSLRIIGSPSAAEIDAAANEAHDQLGLPTGWTDDMIQEHVEEMKAEALSEVESNPLCKRILSYLTAARKRGMYSTWCAEHLVKASLESAISSGPGHRHITTAIHNDDWKEAVDALGIAGLIDQQPTNNSYGDWVLAARLDRPAHSSWIDGTDYRTEAEFFAALDTPWVFLGISREEFEAGHVDANKVQLAYDRGFLTLEQCARLGVELIPF